MLEERFGHMEEQLRSQAFPRRRQVVVVGRWQYDMEAKVIRTDAAPWLSAHGYKPKRCGPGPSESALQGQVADPQSGPHRRRPLLVRQAVLDPE